MTTVPVLTSERLEIRPFVMEDLDAVHSLLDVELGRGTLEAERSRWLQWAVLNYEQLAKMHQPPYGDRAVVLRSTGQFVGACGYVPCLMPFAQLPGLAQTGTTGSQSRFSTEFGLFYAISPGHQRRGYATEAAQALIDYAFRHLHLQRIVATTSYDNVASLGVMRRLGMRIERNPLVEPAWFQVVGVLSYDEVEKEKAEL